MNSHGTIINNTTSSNTRYPIKHVCLSKMHTEVETSLLREPDQLPTFCHQRESNPQPKDYKTDPLAHSATFKVVNGDVSSTLDSNQDINLNYGPNAKH